MSAVHDRSSLVEPPDWARRRVAEEAGRKYAKELLSQPDSVLRAALYVVAEAKPAAFVLARHGPSKEAADIEEEAQRLKVRRLAREIEDASLATDRAEAPSFVSLTDFLQEPDEDVRYRVDGLWPIEGRILLAAQFKAGKTTLVNNLIRSLVDGDNFLGVFAVEPVLRVVLIDNEMSPSQIRRWLRDQGIRNTCSVELVSLRGSLSSFNILDPTVRTEWAQRIGQADVLVFDCLRPVLDALGLSEDKEAGRFLVALDELAREAGVPELFLVHHMGHSNERSRGDSRLLDWPDATWKYVRGEEENSDEQPVRFFSALGRDVEQTEVRVAFDPENRHLTVDGGSRRHATSSRIEDAVQLHVSDYPGCSGGSIEKAVEGNSNTIRDAIRALVAHRVIRVERQGPGKATLHFPSDPGSDFSESDADSVGNVENK